MIHACARLAQSSSRSLRASDKVGPAAPAGPASPAPALHRVRALSPWATSMPSSSTGTGTVERREISSALRRRKEAGVLDPCSTPFGAEGAAAWTPSAPEKPAVMNICEGRHSMPRDECQVGGNLAPQLVLAARVGIEGGRLHLVTRRARANAREERGGKAVGGRHAHLEHRRPGTKCLVQVGLQIGLDRSLLLDGALDRLVRHAGAGGPDETINCASASRSYAVLTVPRATPSCAARSSHDGSLAPGASTPLSIAPEIPMRICSAREVLAVRSRIDLQPTVHRCMVHPHHAFSGLFSGPAGAHHRGSQARKPTMKLQRLLLPTSSSPTGVAFAGAAAAHGAGDTVKPNFDRRHHRTFPASRSSRVEVLYPPGGASLPHAHAKSAFIYAYVVSGSIASKVNDGPERVYKAGRKLPRGPGLAPSASAATPARRSPPSCWPCSSSTAATNPLTTNE